MFVTDDKPPFCLHGSVIKCEKKNQMHVTFSDGKTFTNERLSKGTEGSLS